jgi:hypothetical protein
MTHATARLGFLTLAGCCVSVAIGCPTDMDVEPAQCWCGERWQAQISGAHEYSDLWTMWSIAASQTTYTRCVSMLEHIALDTADPLDPVYVALRNAFESEAIANCEIAGALHWPEHFDHTDCATTGSGNVSTNLSWLGPCWVSEEPDAEPPKTCPLKAACGRFYDCSDEPIMRDAGETGGAEDAPPWSCGAGISFAGDRTF